MPTNVDLGGISAKLGHDLPSVACQAAVELDNLILARIIHSHFQPRLVKNHKTLTQVDLCRSFTAARQKQTVPGAACCQQ